MTTIPLRYSLPLILLLFILSLSLGTLQVTRSETARLVESQSLEELRILINHSQRSMERALAEGKPLLAAEEVTELTSEPRLTRAIFADGRGRVIASTQLADLQKDLFAVVEKENDHAAVWLKQKAAEVTRFQLAQYQLGNQGNSLYGLASIRLSEALSNDPANQRGLLFIEETLDHAKESIFSVMRQRIITLGLLFAWAALLFAVALHFMVTARVRRLVAATERFSQGATGLVTGVGGSDELAQLARKIEEMAAQRSQADEKSRQSLASLARAQAVAKLGSWEWDINSNQIDWSPTTHILFGTNPEEFSPAYETYLSLIHPEDRERVNLAVAQTLETHQPFLVEHRLIQPSGAERILRGEGEVMLDEFGAPIKLLGVVRDITEDKIRLKRISLLAKVFESASEAIMITDHNNQIIETNQAFEQITGYSLDEVRGKDPKVLSSGRHDQDFYEQMWGLLLEQGQWTGEIWDRRKNGEIYPKFASITRFTDEISYQTNYLAVFNDISRVKQTEEELRRRAYYDGLTDLPNRLYFLDQLNHHIQLAKRRGFNIALLFLDLDNFKHVNDSLGHAAGDQLLIEASRMLQDSIRASDLVARLGGDEFVVALIDVKDPGTAATVANEILTKFHRPLLIQNQEVYTHCSIGIAIYPQDGGDAEELLRKGDAAMYQAKERGKGQVSFYTPNLAKDADRKMFLISNLHRALENQEFQVLYQPQVDSRDGVIIGAEALVRWQHPEQGSISPVEFIPVAEETGLILPLGEWVLKTACLQTKAWQDLGLPELVMSVNFSVRQFQKTDVVAMIDRVLAEVGLESRFLKVEITEGLLMVEVQHTIETLTKLRDRQIHASVDDFGTGYSSLSYLNRFPISDLKIDRAFVIDLVQDSSIAKAVISLGHSLNLSVIAEGVENEAQKRVLQQLGCFRIQGYYYARPLPAHEFEEFLRRGRIEPD
ncbi:MAG: EAL domain-containing protein [bacterium]|nr:EAL domain-containing protein [bacterium]